MNLWLRYPLWKAAQYLNMLREHGRRSEVYAHVLRVGPLAFAVIWQEEDK